MDEAALLRRVRQGDETAFAQLFGHYQRPIYRYAARMCGSETADDVVQETFMVVLRLGKRYDEPQPLRVPLKAETTGPAEAGHSDRAASGARFDARVVVLQ